MCRSLPTRQYFVRYRCVTGEQLKDNSSRNAVRASVDISVLLQRSPYIRSDRRDDANISPYIVGRVSRAIEPS